MIYVYLYGRIGNNLFQIAAAASLANRINTQFAAVPLKSWCPRPDNCYLQDYLKQFRNNILRNVPILDKIPNNLTEFKPEVDEEFKPIPPCDELLLNGYFQSEKYFEADIIRDLFKINKETYDYINRKYGHLLFHNTITSINVRRGDYLDIPQYYSICSMSYFNKAIRYLGRGNKYIVISDDIEWCKGKFKGENFYFVENELPVIQLYIQTLCTNNIISNSSFSWWGAWLNNNPSKIVIYPKTWYGKYYKKIPTTNLTPPSWIQIENKNNIKYKFIFLFIQIKDIAKKIIKILLESFRQ